MEQNPPAHYDVVIIGGGPGGYAAALYGASAGLKIAIVEKDKVGGSCLHRGCIPAKELLESASVNRTVRHAAEFGVYVDEPKIDWSVTVDRKQRVIDQMWGGLKQLLSGRKVDIYAGVGTLGPSHQVNVVADDGTSAVLLGTAVILATGSVPRTIPGFDPDGRIIFTSDEFLDLRTLPAKAAVIGGGAIGCEFASTLADMGTEVTILEGLPKILPGCDKDAAAIVERSFKKKGMTIRTGVSVTGHTPRPDGGTSVAFGEETLDVDIVVVSVGRAPVANGVVADGTGVSVSERGFFEVDEHCRTGEPGVWAIGDCIATPQLAHIGFIEGINAIKDILGENPAAVDYGKVPWAIYCHPEVSFAGYTEESAKEAGYEVVTNKHRFIGNGRAVILGETDGLVKVIAEKRPDGSGGKILGVHMVGPWVTEQLGQGYLAVNWEATVDELAALIQPHPSMSELFGETVIALTGRSLH
ncbi:MAG TPA: dihydrolipoyl dehydrogenase [Microthrixaceae bacterium]|nr:dihydrolipoyl dehydrogenase [Microthrixaceae bacterium]HNI36141.1 dihydrolipoyl dehydrogenase [Microthrixaceae bacterium]